MNPSPKRRTWSFVLVILVALLAFTMVMRRSAPTPEVFDTKITLTQANAEAAKTGKPVLVFATADWCGYCQKMKRGALKDQTVQQWIRLNTHPVYLDCTKEVPAEARGLPIDGFPTLLLLREGESVAALGGAAPTAEVIRWFEANAGALADEKARGGM
jgi:protein disulfide-isomerase